MATKIISSAERIIFSGHANTRDECETISLACEELAKSDKFRTVKYGSGYAEFEKASSARELTFPPNSTIEILSNDGSTTLYFDGSAAVIGDTFELIVTATGVGGVCSYVYSGDKTFLGVATTPNATTPTYPVGSSFESTESVSLYIVEQAATPTISFTRRYQNSTLIGTGTYKFRRYSVEEPVQATQEGTVLTIANANVTQSGTEVTIT